MKKIHIVGKEGSFTHQAVLKRYPGEYSLASYSHHDLVTALEGQKIPKSEVPVVPLWNSNTGVINMEQVTKTTSVFRGDAGYIRDLWPHEILFRLAIPDGSLTKNSRLFSVKVAEFQCSRYLNKNGILNDKRFEGLLTTTAAMAEFLAKRKKGDGILCAESLLLQNGLVPLADTVTNPYNMTVFAIIKNLPQKQKSPSKFFLGCFTTPIEGHELPVEFLDYYERLAARLSKRDDLDIVASLPKIIFIVRDEKGKALMLLEMQSESKNGADWEPPDVETSIQVTEVGALQQSYVLEVAELMNNRFACGDYCFYGSKGCYVWACPHLKISVHGYDKDLVVESARMQVLQLKALVDAGHSASAEAKRLLKLATNLKQLGLTPDSVPIPTDG